MRIEKTQKEKETQAEQTLPRSLQATPEAQLEQLALHNKAPDDAIMAPWLLAFWRW